MSLEFLVPVPLLLEVLAFRTLTRWDPKLVLLALQIFRETR